MKLFYSLFFVSSYFMLLPNLAMPCDDKKNENVSGNWISSDNLENCYSEKNGDFYTVKYGVKCFSGDYKAGPCYLPDGRVVPVRKNENGVSFYEACRNLGGKRGSTTIRR